MPRQIAVFVRCATGSLSQSTLTTWWLESRTTLSSRSGSRLTTESGWKLHRQAFTLSTGRLNTRLTSPSYTTLALSGTMVQMFTDPPSAANMYMSPSPTSTFTETSSLNSEK
ncbi:PP94 [Orf virus]|uniref:PP94 n=1 Tax=Orf virus TaxID=10258 RepID=F1AX26_ORFV|nr:PP94 [Orf virus]